MAGIPEFGQVLTVQRVAGTLFNTYTTAKSIIDPTNLVPLPVNYLKLGSRFKLRAAGGLSNIAPTPGTITFQVMIGSAVAWSSGAIQLNATAHTLLPFILDLEFWLSVIGSGTSAKLRGMGTLNGIMFTNTAAQTDAANTTGMFPVPATAPADGSGFDSTVANNIDFWAGFSISNAGNGIQLSDYKLIQEAF